MTINFHRVASFHENGEFRNETHKRWIYYFASFLFVLLACLTYCWYNGDVDRFYSGYDHCGNICGASNFRKPYIMGCERKNMRNLPLLQEGDLDTCVARCENGYFEIANRCISWYRTEEEKPKTNGIGTVLRDVLVVAPEFITVASLSVISSCVLLLMFRFATKFVIGVVLSVKVIMDMIAFFSIWEYFGTTLNAVIILSALAAIVITVMVFLLLKKIEMTGKIFKEASTVLTYCPMMMLQPFCTLAVLSIATVIFYHFTMIISYSGTFESLGNTVVLSKDWLMNLAQALNFFGFIWFCQFVLGCQHFIIAGTVSNWYFSREKTKLEKPIATAYHNLLCYHLGSIIKFSPLGLCMITLKFIRMFLMGVKYFAELIRKPCTCMEKTIAAVDKFFSYCICNCIIVAKDGTSFAESNLKALTIQRFINVIGLNFVGDLVLMIARIYIAIMITFLAYSMMYIPKGLNSIEISKIVAGFVAFIITHCFISVFEMTVDTIFLCYCEDCDENGKEGKPYYMSDDLKAVMYEMISVNQVTAPNNNNNIQPEVQV